MSLENHACAEEEEFYENPCGDDAENSSFQVDAATQQGDALTQFGCEQPMTADSRSNPDTDVWGVLRRKGGNQEEIKLRHRIKDGKRDTYVIGRHSGDCDIVVKNNKSVSSIHCRIYCDYTQARLRVFIEDSSTNGTFINDSLTRLSGERMELKSGDEIFLVNPRNLLGRTTHGSHSAQDGPDAGEPAFMFVNIRDRIVAYREKSKVPLPNEQMALAPLKRHVEDEYVIGDQIGSGMCGTVHLCIERATGVHWAVKIIDTKKFALSPGLSPADLREEANMMKDLDHSNIIRIKDTFETDNIIFIVMELVRGGDLFDRIVEKGRYTEDEARPVMQKVLSAVKYLHSRDIIHRDLKPENILLAEPNNDIEVKITDFGLAKRTNQEGLKTFCGTPQYFAPEVLKRKHTKAGMGTYGTSADMWSLGVIMYILLSGTFPFDEENLLDQVQNAQYSLSGAEWANISESAKHLVRSMMTLRPDQRLTVDRALAHPWITNEKFQEKPNSLFSQLSSGITSSTASNSNGNQRHAALDSKGSKRTASVSKRKSTKAAIGINRKQSGSQGILQALAAKQSKQASTGEASHGGYGNGSIASIAVAAAYGSFSAFKPSLSAASMPLAAPATAASVSSIAVLSTQAQSTTRPIVHNSAGYDGTSLYAKVLTGGGSMIGTAPLQTSRQELPSAEVSVENALQASTTTSPVLSSKKRTRSPSKVIAASESRPIANTTTSIRPVVSVTLPRSINLFPDAVELSSDKIDEFSDEEILDPVHAREETVTSKLLHSASGQTGAHTKSTTKLASGKKKTSTKMQQSRNSSAEPGPGSLESAWKRVVSLDENVLNEPVPKSTQTGPNPPRKLRVAPKTIADLFKHRDPQEHE